MTNPLLDFAALPRFTEILPEHVSPAVDSVLAEARTVLARVIDVATPARWEAVMVPLSDSTARACSCRWL